MTGFALRDASPEDAPFLAWAILAATRSHLSKGWFDIAFALPDVQLLGVIERLVRAETRSLWHFSYFQIAALGGEPAAALAAFRSADAFPPSQAAIDEVAHDLGWAKSELDAIEARGSYIYTCLFDGDADPDAWIIENVATRPDYRGRGAAGRLVRRALAIGRERGHEIAQLTEMIGNTRARRVYEREGFTVIAERRHPQFEAATGAPGFARLSCKL